MPGHPCHVAAQIFGSVTGYYRSQVPPSQLRAFEWHRSGHRIGLRRRGASDRRHSAPHDTSSLAWELQATPINKIWQLLKQLPPAATLPYLVGGCCGYAAPPQPRCRSRPRAASQHLDRSVTIGGVRAPYGHAVQLCYAWRRSIADQQ